MSLKQLFTFVVYLFFATIILIEARHQLNGNKKWSFQNLLPEDINTINDDPPDYKKYAKMARFIVHESDYVSIATISTYTEVKGYPFVNIISMSDGPRDKSSGIPYMYTTMLDFTPKDLKKDNRCTLMASLVQSSYCKDKNYDPEDPRCAHVILSGKIVKLKKGTDEYNFANSSLFERHPVMKTWPKDHEFFFMKLNITNILLQDYFGGPQNIPLDEYLAVKLYKLNEKEDYISFHDNNDVINETKLNYEAIRV